MALDARCQFGAFCCWRVGAGLARARDELGIGRDALFVQSKFTPLPGQGRDVPHDRRAAPSEQVEQSLARSLSNLGIDYLDSYLLHAPQGWHGLTDADWAVRESLEAAYRHGCARRIGISNAELPHLEELLAQARVAPMAVQNRCFARDGWDRDVRDLCVRHGIAYQGFSLLTANARVLREATVRDSAARLEATPAQLVFAFARVVGMIPLTGTTRERHMADDLAALEIALDDDAVAALERLGGR